MGHATKSDEFSERFQTTVDPHPSEKSLSLEIMCMHFILSGHHTSLHICNHIYHKKNCNIILWKWGAGGGSKAVWNLSVNSSDSVIGPFPNHDPVDQKDNLPETISTFVILEHSIKYLVLSEIFQNYFSCGYWNTFQYQILVHLEQ